jgi:hypothetical protein
LLLHTTVAAAPAAPSNNRWVDSALEPEADPAAAALHERNIILG